MTPGGQTHGRNIVNPGVVRWSGENPGIWLEETRGGPYTTLVTFFRVRHSPEGGGHAAFVLLDPRGGGKHPQQNLCLTDNEPLARYLCGAFVNRFTVFRDLPGFHAMEYRTVDRFEASGDTRHRWVERAVGDSDELELVWEGLKEPYFAEMPADRSPTGDEIFALFIEATDASVRLNDYVAPGRLSTRDFYGRPASTAFLAFGETWVAPPNTAPADPTPKADR